jgi:hypothetical protein
LQEEFCTLLGSTNVYFQPPESVKMNYPAIRYNLKGFDKIYANDGSYRLLPIYEVTLIDHNPDSMFVEKILQLPCCKFDRFYPANNLNHFVFTLHY